METGTVRRYLNNKEIELGSESKDEKLANELFDLFEPFFANRRFKQESHS